MQRQVRHGQSSTRRKGKRRDPRVKYFGFTAMQWPFIATLVGNWLFSAAVFAAGKMFWDWTPEAWGIADRLALVIKDAVIAIIPGVIGICIVAAQRLDPSMFVGQVPKPNSPVEINTTALFTTPAARGVAKASQRYVYSDYRLVDFAARRNAAVGNAQLAAEIVLRTSSW